MSGVGGWREGSRYRTATAFNTPSSSQGNPHGNNETEKGENTQKLTASEEKKGGQASAHQQQQKQYVGPYVLVTPNETRRKQLQQIAKKELDDLEQWKKEHRPGPITLVPQRLGGNESEARVRQNQQMILMESKYQKKHKREEYVKAKKAAEEAEILKKKAIQREKAERLEVKKRQEEMQRREMLLEDQKYKTNELLSRLDVGLPKSDFCQIANPGPESTAWKRSHAYKQALREDENRRLEEMRQEQRRKAELLEFKQKQEEETRTRALKNEQRRLIEQCKKMLEFHSWMEVNNAFLDRLQNKTLPNNIYHPGYTGLPQ
ncbi:epithelial-stromal interaction protein 1 isoform X1 [Haemorhous mexicanus]|uniref:epithelial-stromal interaction protein 1 isoform X1 n=1 Tax=Haemorhous mexicanus TaxID=30427 RepID=UPI0028BD8F93|nr:epithelial-stromal interaction protein 1 isoform X1 [Haemorhous mexicanus]XP_059695058.1 epithelial-stromal interaction protein 1 isoform X1 [Haemorhous mexicanus]